MVKIAVLYTNGSEHWHCYKCGYHGDGEKKNNGLRPSISEEDS